MAKETPTRVQYGMFLLLFAVVSLAGATLEHVTSSAYRDGETVTGTVISVHQQGGTSRRSCSGQVQYTVGGVTHTVQAPGGSYLCDEGGKSVEVSYQVEHPEKGRPQLRGDLTGRVLLTAAGIITLVLGLACLNPRHVRRLVGEERWGRLLTLQEHLQSDRPLLGPGSQGPSGGPGPQG